MPKQVTVTVKAVDGDIEVTVDPVAGIQFIEGYDLKANPRDLNEIALKKISDMQSLVRSRTGALTVKQLGFAKLLFTHAIVPLPLSERVETVRCIKATMKGRGKERKLVRCETQVTGTRAELAQGGSMCEPCSKISQREKTAKNKADAKRIAEVVAEEAATE